MIIYVDENIPSALADGLNVLQEPINVKKGINVNVRSLIKDFGIGAKDEVWIPLAGEKKACIITQDYNIQRKKIQRKLVEEYGLGMVYIRPPSKMGFQYWELVKLIVKHWEQIIEIALKEQRPFSYSITARGGRPEKI